MNLEYLKKLSTEFRTAILKCNRTSRIATFREFPKGFCGEASILLSRYLKDMHQGTFIYISGEISYNKNFQSHAWLQKKNIIVDITADQFKKITSPVIVTIDGSWYKQFSNLQSWEVIIENFRGPAKITLLSSYKTIVSNIMKELRPSID